MSQILSLNSHDYLSMQIVPVIASFNSDGQIKPLFVGLNGERYKIDSYWVGQCFSNQIIFHCKVITGDTLRPLILTYYMHECIWTIPNHSE